MARRLKLFQAAGLELEYMIVAADSLAALPITDRVLHAVAGAYDSEIDLGEISWSNELALHVIELKTSGPAAALADLPARFQQLGLACVFVHPLRSGAHHVRWTRVAAVSFRAAPPPPLPPPPPPPR